MDYRKIYDRFIESRRAQEDGLRESALYRERHHISPVSLGGGNGKANLILMTAREHYFAHCCLAKIFGGKMWSALFCLANMTKVDPASAYFLKGRMVAIAKERAARVRSENMTRLWGDGEFKRDRVYAPRTTETKEKIRAGNIGKRMTRSSVDKMLATKRACAEEFTFFCIDTGEKFLGTQAEFCDFTKIDQPLASCLTRGKIRSAKGWVLSGSNLSAINGRDPTTREFTHKDGQRFVGTTYEFRTKYQLDSGAISNLVHGKNRVQSFKGWKYFGEARSWLAQNV